MSKKAVIRIIEGSDVIAKVEKDANSVLFFSEKEQTSNTLSLLPFQNKKQTVKVPLLNAKKVNKGEIVVEVELQLEQKEKESKEDLRIVVLKIVSLDVVGSTNPYVVTKLGPKNDSENSALIFGLRDSNSKKVGSDGFVGTGTVSIQQPQFPINKKQTLTVPLEKEKGRIVVDVEVQKGNRVKWTPAEVGTFEASAPIRERSFGVSEPTPKAREFTPTSSAPAPSESVPSRILPNSDAPGMVGSLNQLPLTLRNSLPLGPTCFPYSFIVDRELNAGVFQILLTSELAAPAWGRWAGVLSKSNLGLKTFHIPGNNSLDHDTAQISILGVKSGGQWRHRVANYVEPAGRVELLLEYQAGPGSRTGILRGLWNKGLLPWGVKGIPAGVYFTFEVPNSQVLTVQAVSRLAAPALTAATQGGVTDYNW